MIGGILWVLGTAATVIALFALVPRLEISFPSRLDPMRPLAANFTIRNAGTFPVYNVACAYLARNLPNTLGIEFRNSGFSDASMRTKRLNPDDRLTFSVEKGIVFPPGAITSAEIEMVVAANPALWPFTKKYTRAAFRIHRSESGELEWFATPPSGPLPSGIYLALR